MTRVLAKYKSKVISRHPIQKFMVKIDNCKVELESRQQELIIQISGKSGEKKNKGTPFRFGKFDLFLFRIISFYGIA